jgi:hypothetical protein
MGGDIRVFFAGEANRQEDSRIRESGVDFVLQKPCTMRDFQEMVEKELSSLFLPCFCFSRAGRRRPPA